MTAVGTNVEMNGRTPAETITAFDYEGTDNTTLDGKLLA
jgi:hypothetical protein